VKYALADCLVKLPGCDAKCGLRAILVISVGGFAEMTYRGLQRRLDALVAHPRLLVGAVALDLGLDVRHEAASTLVWTGNCALGRHAMPGQVVALGRTTPRAYQR